MILRLILSFVILHSSFVIAATGDFVFYQVPATGPLTKKLVTPGTSKLFGWGSSASTPVAITLGSGLSLDTGTNILTASSAGTVTSVALTAPSILSVAGSPVTTSGTLALSLATQSANTVFAGPTTGSAAAPAFRALVAADIPSLSAVYQPLNARLTGIGNLTPGSAEKAVILEADGTMSTKAYSYGGNGGADQGLIPEYSNFGVLYAGGGATGDQGFLGFTLDGSAVSGQVSDGAAGTGVGVLGISTDSTGDGVGVKAVHNSATGTAFMAGGGTGQANLVTLGNGTTILGGGTSASEFRILEPSGSGTNYFGFKAQAMSADAVFTLPAADGTSGQALTTNGSKVLSFASITSKVVQIIYVSKTDTASVASTTWASLMSGSITPTSASNKVIVLASVATGHTAGGGYPYFLRVARSGTPLLQGDAAGSRERTQISGYNSNVTALKEETLVVSESPSSTSALTYDIEGKTGNAGTTLYLNRSSRDSNLANEDARGASYMLLIEVTP